MSLTYDNDNLQCGKTKVNLRCTKYTPYSGGFRKNDEMMCERDRYQLILLNDMIDDRHIYETLRFTDGDNVCSFFINRQTDIFKYENNYWKNGHKSEYIDCPYESNKDVIIEFLKHVKSNISH